MAIFGFGATYDQSSRDVSGDFIKKGAACVGWPEEEAPALYNILRQIKLGDVVYLKSYRPQIGLTIKAVGIVVGNVGKDVKDFGLGWGVRLEWLWRGEEVVGKDQRKYPVRSCTLYEEPDPIIQKAILRLLLPKLK